MGELPKTMKALVAYGLGDYRLELDYPVRPGRYHHQDRGLRHLCRGSEMYARGGHVLGR